MSKHSRFILLLVAVFLIGTFSAVKAQGAAFKVAAVAPSAKNDLAFSQSMYDALSLIKTELGEETFDFTFQEGTFVVDDAAAALREWAASGEYQLIIAHGSQYGAVVEELAKEFPDISFAWGTDVNTFGLDNVFAYTPAADQGGYINGAVAAMMTKSKVIGVVGPIEVGDAKLYVDGFVAGAAATDPDVKVNVTYIQSFSDVPLATEAAKAHVANGADILTGTAQMVVGPIAVAQESNALWFGTQSSQAELAAKAGVMFQVYHWEIVLTDMLLSISEGTKGGISYTLTLENGGLEMQISDKNEMSDEDRAALQKTVGDLMDEVIAMHAEPEMTPEATPGS